MCLYHSIMQFSSTRLSMVHYSFQQSLQARSNPQVLKCLFATLKSVNMCNFMPWEVKLSLSRRITLYFNENMEASMVQLNLSYTKICKRPHPEPVCQALCTHNSFILPPFPIAAQFPVREGPYITVYNISATTVVNFFSLSHSLFLSSGVPSGYPEHMCFGLPREEPYLSPGCEQTAGFVCGTINQLSFNKNRKPDERQREETWGVGPYVGRKKSREGKKEGKEKREGKKGGCLTQIQAFNKSSSNNNNQSFHVAWLINQAFFFLTWEERESFLLFLSCLSCGRWQRGWASPFMLDVYVLMLQGFRCGGWHRSWFNESKAFSSRYNRTISVKVSGYINGKQGGFWKDMDTHIPTHTKRHTGVWSA